MWNGDSRLDKKNWMDCQRMPKVTGFITCLCYGSPTEKTDTGISRGDCQTSAYEDDGKPLTPSPCNEDNLALQVRVNCIGTTDQSSDTTHHDCQEKFAPAH